MTAEPINRILVARVGAIGDTLMTTPAVRALCEKHPGFEVDFLCSSLAAPILRGNPRISHLYTLRYRNLPFALSPEKWWLARQLRVRRYSSAVLLESAPQYRELIERAAPGEIRSFRETPSDPELHSIANNLRAAGFHDWASHSVDMDLLLTGDELADGRKLLAGSPRPLVAIHAGYGPSGKKAGQATRLRGWPTASFARLIQLLAGRGVSVVLTGSAGDAEEANLISTFAGVETARVLAGKTSLRQMAGVVSMVDAVISVDSAPAHLAAAAGTPLVVLWGPGILQQTRPVSSKSPVTILRHEVPCAPCYGTPLMRTCRDNICMKAISPEEAFEATLGALNRPDRPFTKIEET